LVAEMKSSKKLKKQKNHPENKNVENAFFLRVSDILGPNRGEIPGTSSRQSC